jgi:hypothetical protein
VESKVGWHYINCKVKPALNATLAIHKAAAYASNIILSITEMKTFELLCLRYHGKIGVTPASNLKPQLENGDKKLNKPVYDYSSVQPINKVSIKKDFVL